MKMCKPNLNFLKQEIVYNAYIEFNVEQNRVYNANF